MDGKGGRAKKMYQQRSTNLSNAQDRKLNMKNQTFRKLLFPGICLVIILLPVVSLGSEGICRISADRENQRISAELSGVLLSEVAKALAEKTGIVIRMDASSDYRITCTMENLPLEEAILRLTHTLNTVFVFESCTFSAPEPADIPRHTPEKGSCRKIAGVQIFGSTPGKALRFLPEKTMQDNLPSKKPVQKAPLVPGGAQRTLLALGSMAGKLEAEKVFSSQKIAETRRKLQHRLAGETDIQNRAALLRKLVQTEKMETRMEYAWQKKQKQYEKAVAKGIRNKNLEIERAKTKERQEMVRRDAGQYRMQGE